MIALHHMEHPRAGRWSVDAVPAASECWAPAATHLAISLSAEAAAATPATALEHPAANLEGWALPH